MTEYCELQVKDQNGRRVRGVRAVTVTQRMREVTTVTVEFIPFFDGKPEAPK